MHKTKTKQNKKLNLTDQFYSNVRLNLIPRNYEGYKAKRYALNNSNQNIWIPNVYLLEDGTIKPNANLDWIFRKWDTRHKIELAKNQYNLTN